MALSFTVSNPFLWSILHINITHTVVPILGFHVSMVRGALARISDCRNGEFLLILKSRVSQIDFCGLLILNDALRMHL